MAENTTVKKTDEEMSAELKPLQTRALIGKILMFGGFGAAAISGMVIDNTVAVVACIVVCVVGGFLSTNATKKIKEIIGNGVLKQVFEEVFDDVNYSPFDHLSESQVDEADFGFNYDKMEGNDYVKAKYKGLNIEMSDVDLIEVSTDSDGDTQESTVFRGLWMICDFGKQLTTDLRVCERSKLGKLMGKSGIKTENEAFNKQFNITCENEEQAFYILTPHMMEYIVKMDEKADAKTYLAFLSKGKLHIALNSNRDAFEVKGTMTDVAKIREQFIGEIHQVTDLIDELRLVDTAFKA